MASPLVRTFRRLAITTVFMTVTLAAQATQLDPVFAALQTGDLTSARAAARQISSPDSKSLHILGVLELALGDPAAASEVFGRALEGVGAESAPSGLEAFFVPGSPLYRALSKQKTVVSLSVGKASLHNNRGAALVLLNRPDEAFKDLDLAAVVGGDWGVPWANGAMAWQLKNSAVKAAESARKAIDLGERSPQAFTTLATSEIELGLLDRARDDIEKALQADPDYPYALLAKSKLSDKEGRGRDSQRALTQALANGVFVAVDSNFDPAAGEGNGFGGDTSETHIKLLNHGLLKDGFGYRLRAQTDRLRIESRARSEQKTDQLEAAVGGRFGTIYYRYLDADGGRPGLEDSDVGVSPAPFARFDYRDSFLSWQRAQSLPGGGTLTLHAAQRDSRVDSKLTRTGDWTTRLRDEQTWAEARWDQRAGFDSGLSVGLAYSTINRSGAGGTPIEPIEQIYSNGKTRLWTGYGLVRSKLMENVGLTWGAFYGRAEDEAVLAPVADLAVRLTGSRTLHFLIKPKINEAGSNLMPLAFVADVPQRNTIDRHVASTQNENADPTFLEPTGKQTNYELVFSQVTDSGNRFDTILFYKTLSDFRTQGSDPRLAPDMILTSHDEGWALGIAERVRLPMPSNFALRAYGAIQTSKADFRLSTYDAEDYPVKTGSSDNRLPNFPTFQASLALDWSRGGTDLALELHHIGQRQRAITVNEVDGDVVYLSQADPATTLNFYFRQKIGGLASFRVSVFNLGRESFYPGYGGDITMVAGFDYKF